MTNYFLSLCCILLNTTIMKKSYKLNGKYVDKKDINKDAILVQVVNEEHYETPEYKRQQSVNAMNYFAKLAEDREELEKRHG